MVPSPVFYLIRVRVEGCTQVRHPGQATRGGAMRRRGVHEPGPIYPRAEDVTRWFPDRLAKGEPSGMTIVTEAPLSLPRGMRAPALARDDGGRISARCDRTHLWY